MDETPAVPTPPPDIPKGKLWASLLAPLGVTFLGCTITVMVSQPGDYGRDELLYVLPVALLAILVALGFFISAWRVRYRGASLVLTALGFLIGQVVLCLALWFGSCMIPAL